MADVPAVLLNNGVHMPQVGFGTSQIRDHDAAEVVGRALEVGYRSIDTAAIFGNEKGVGEALKRSGIPRHELFVTTKLWNTAHGYEPALKAFDESLRRLGLEYIDLYLIHWPAPARGEYVHTWKALEKIAADGRARAVGVSNFQIPHLRRLSEETSTVPAVNQIELHPMLVQSNLRAYHSEHGIITEAWSPLARGQAIANDEIRFMAQKYGKTPAQIILRWHLELRHVVIPKSVGRMAENLGIFDFELDEDDVHALTDLHDDTRVGPHPDNFS